MILPLKNNDGETITQMGDKYISLFPFVNGVQFISDDIKTPIQASENLGAQLGRIHKSSEVGYPEISEKFKLWDKDEFNKVADSILDIINNKKSLTDFDKLAKETILFKKECVRKDSLPYEILEKLPTGLIHGDYHDGNVFFDKDAKIISVFDFEKACIAPYVFEIIRAIRYSHSTGYGRSGSEKYVNSFLQGYRKERPVDSEELKIGIKLLYQREIYGLWVEKEHYLKNNFRTDNLLQTKEFLLSTINMHI